MVMWDETSHIEEHKKINSNREELDFFEEKMSVDLKKYIDDIENHHIDAINELKKCIHCNYCKNVSSTWILSKEEKDSHSSKLYLINEFNSNRNRKKIAHTIFNVADPTSISKVCPCSINHEKSFLELKYKSFVDIIQDDNYKQIKLALNNLKNQKFLNIWGEKVDKKLNWLKEKENLDLDMLYYISDFEGFKDKDRIKNTLWFLTKAKIPYSISKDAPNTGQFPEIVGDLSTSKFLEKKFREYIKTKNYRKIITSSPLEYERLKRIYDEVNLKEDKSKNVEVFFILEYLSNKIKTLSNKKIMRMKGNYAILDNQIISKYFGYDFIRKILKNMGCGVVEIMHSKRESFSIGAGTGFDIMHAEKTIELAKIYLKEAENAGAEYIVACCPMEYKALKTAKRTLKTKVMVTNALEIATKALKWSL